jgi:dTDP-glucose 4,6-dehydratase
MKKETILITGGCGFIGSHFVEHILKNTEWDINIIDKMSYASKDFKRLNSLSQKDRFNIYTWDLICPVSEGLINMLSATTIIVHMAAETHVDNSITQPEFVIKNNIMSTVNILEFSRKLRYLRTFFYFSTDEVYGPALGDKMYTEDERHNPTNPYSASKSGAEQICMAYYNTFSIPLIRINVMNAFGEKQHVEKFIPKVIKSILENKTVQIHSYPDKIKTGTRFYIHARNIAAGVLFLLEKGNVGECYNLVGEKEVSNLDLALQISKIMNKELKFELVDFHSDRPGLDLRYGLDGSKMDNMGWKLPVNFEKGLQKTVEWTLENKDWLK